MPRGVKTENGEKLSATERRARRIAERQEKLAQKNDEVPNDELFEKAAKEVSRAARQIGTDVRDWMYGDIEAEQLMTVLRADWSRLESAVGQLSVVYRALVGK
jgi:hypothetical protein